MALEQRQIGNTNISVSCLGLGGTSLGNLYEAVQDSAATELVVASAAAGVNFFDTAPCYGVGLSEQRLGSALRSIDRASFVLSTKVGYALVPMAPGEERPSLFVNTPRCRTEYDFSFDGAMRSIEGSLARLRLDRVDMVAIHDPDETAGADPNADPYAHSHFKEAMDGAYRALEKLRGEKVIGAIGVGMNQWQMLLDFVRAGSFDYVLLAGRYTLLQHDAAPSLMPACIERGVSVVIGGPYCSGILASGAVEGAYFNYAPASPEMLAHVRRIETICAECGISLRAAALAFALRHPAVVSVIPGARSVDELRGNLAAVAETVPDAFWSTLVTERLLPENALG